MGLQHTMKFYVASSAENCSSTFGSWVTTQSKLRHQCSSNSFSNIIDIKKISAAFRQLNRFRARQYYHWHEIPKDGDLHPPLYLWDSSGYVGMQNKISQREKCRHTYVHKWKKRTKGNTLQENKYRPKRYPGGRSIKMQKYSRIMFKCQLVRYPLLQQHASTSR